MRVPSGDHEGSVSSPGLLERSAGPDPSRLMTQMSKPRALPEASEPAGATYNSRVPSGDQRGLVLSPGPNVSCLGLLPSGFISHTWSVWPSSRSVTNAICPPPPSWTTGTTVGSCVGSSVGTGVGAAVAGGGMGLGAGAVALGTAAGGETVGPSTGVFVVEGAAVPPEKGRSTRNRTTATTPRTP